MLVTLAVSDSLIIPTLSPSSLVLVMLAVSDTLI
jgi:hypothetical protein